MVGFVYRKSLLIKNSRLRMSFSRTPSYVVIRSLISAASFFRREVRTALTCKYSKWTLFSHGDVADTQRVPDVRRDHETPSIMAPGASSYCRSNHPLYLTTEKKKKLHCRNFSCQTRKSPGMNLHQSEVFHGATATRSRDCMLLSGVQFIDHSRRYWTAKTTEMVRAFCQSRPP